MITVSRRANDIAYAQYWSDDRILVRDNDHEQMQFGKQFERDELPLMMTAIC